MTRVMSRVALAVAAVCVTAVVATAQQTSSATETKSFEIIAVDGNQLIVKLPEGTRELTVPSDFRFTVNGQQLAVSELKAGMKGSATVTTRTTVTPVTVTEVKNGTVVQRSGSTIIVRTGNQVKMFSQGDIDKRGIKIVKDGRPAELSDFREGDQLSATIVTSRPPHIMTQKEVQATVPTAAATSGGASAGKASSGAPAASSRTNAASSSTAASSGATAGGTGKTLPKTASSWPMLALASVLLLAMGLALTLARRFVG